MFDATFRAPDRIDWARYHLRPLAVTDLILVLEAWDRAGEQIRSRADPRFAPWPLRKPGIRDACRLLLYSRWAHDLQAVFSYGLFNEEESRLLGCVVISPGRTVKSGVNLETWAVQDDRDLDRELFEFSRDWLDKEWPVSGVACPGRGDDWEECAHGPVVDPAFMLPEQVPFAGHVLCTITMEDTLLDYRAYMSSIDYLQPIYSPAYIWPTTDITLDMALGDLAACEQQTVTRRNIVYGIFNPDHSEEIGCLYLGPSHDKAFDTEATWWFSKEYGEAGYGKRLQDFLDEWLSSDWPFHAVSYPPPGRIPE